VGTLFSEDQTPAFATKGKPKARATEHVNRHYQIEKAQERANSSVILALTSFIPLIGLIMGLSAIVLAAMATRTLKAQNVEDGRGSATAGMAIGILGLIAQGGYLVYVLKSGSAIAG